MARVLVTGSRGCIGATAVDWLLEEGAEEVIGFNRSKPSFHEAQESRLSFVTGDISDFSRLREVVRELQPSHVLHLAALQTPDCRDYPMRGLEVNLVGTANLFRACSEELKKPLERFVFASSGAVYGPRSLYGPKGVCPEDPYQPFNLYGYWKIAGEGMAQAFQQATGAPTVSLRLATTYGPGRDRGFTAAGTHALKAVALALPFEIPYKGHEHYHFSPDVGAGFGCTVLHPFSGYGAFNLRGQSQRIEDFLELLRQTADNRSLSERFKVSISPDAEETPFVFDLNDDSAVSAFPLMPLTNLRQGISDSLDFFLGAAERGEISAADLA
jgi:nucleoside-diphosphate-sugar epimerase|tara:strand:+ start:1222 stop:2205 length:984 start_codon:yes stop_codon:yes gene_type:complete